MTIPLFRWLTLGGILFWMAVYWQGRKKTTKDIHAALQIRGSPLDTWIHE